MDKRDARIRFLALVTYCVSLNDAYDALGSFCAKISPDARGILFTRPMLNMQCTHV